MVISEDRHRHPEHFSLPSTLPSFICWDNIQHGISLESVGVRCLATFPPRLLAGEMLWEAGKALILCEHWSAVTKIPLCYQHCFQHRCKPQPVLVTMKKINSMTAKTSTITIKMSSGQRKREKESERQEIMCFIQCSKKELVPWQQYLPLTVIDNRYT